MADKLHVTMVQHPKIAQILTEIHGDNGGCTATEWEKMLEDFSNAELSVIAAGEEREVQAMLTKMKLAALRLGYNEHQAKSLVGNFHDWLNKAFD